MLTRRGQESWVEQRDRVCVGVTAHDSAGVLAKGSLERMAMIWMRKIKGMRPKVGSHPSVGTAATSVTEADVQETLNDMADRQKQLMHQLRISRRLSRTG